MLRFLNRKDAPSSLIGAKLCRLKSTITSGKQCRYNYIYATKGLRRMQLEHSLSMSTFLAGHFSRGRFVCPRVDIGHVYCLRSVLSI